jgi:hypothetical protein
VRHSARDEHVRAQRPVAFAIVGKYLVRGACAPEGSRVHWEGTSASQMYSKVLYWERGGQGLGMGPFPDGAPGRSGASDVQCTSPTQPKSTTSPLTWWVTLRLLQLRESISLSPFYFLALTNAKALKWLPDLLIHVKLLAKGITALEP